MKLSVVKERLSANEIIAFDVMPNPGDLSEWVVWVRESSGGSYLLLNEDESFVRSKNANEILSILKNIGAKYVGFSL